MARNHLRRLIGLTPDDGRALLGTVRGPFEAAGGLGPLETHLLDAIGERVLHVDPATVAALTVDEAPGALTDDELRHRAVDLMVVLELTRHPLPEVVEQSVAAYARALGVDEPMVRAAREYAEDHIAHLYADIQRFTWYTEEVGHSMLHGGFRRIVRSKLAYQGVAADRKIAKKWEALADCEPGTWGRELADFYAAHHFPFPGQKHGITELGANHDWVHVLAGYDTTPEDELDVFAFISAASEDPHAFTLLVTTLALFQNGAISHVAGKKVAIACRDALEASGAADRFADALGRGAACTADALALDHFAYKDEPLDHVRRRFEVPPRAAA